MTKRGKVMAVAVALVAFLVGVFVGPCVGGWAEAAPLRVHVHHYRLDPSTADVRVYGNVRGPGTATLRLDPYDTTAPIAQWFDPTIVHVRLERGMNRIHRTISVTATERTYCGWRQEFKADHPECPFLPAFRRPYEPYLNVPHGFDRVRVEGVPVTDEFPHWHWRRKRDRAFGVWESSAIGLDENGRPAWSPFVSAQDWVGGPPEDYLSEEGKPLYTIQGSLDAIDRLNQTIERQLREIERLRNG